MRDGHSASRYRPSPTLPDCRARTSSKGSFDGLYSWSLILILAALVVAAIAWAWGAQSNHHGATSGGRRGVLIAAGAGLLVGMAPQIVNFFYGIGRQ